LLKLQTSWVWGICNKNVLLSLIWDLTTEHT
jgi:hypothetical protein